MVMYLFGKKVLLMLLNNMQNKITKLYGIDYKNNIILYFNLLIIKFYIENKY
jgi:hypothetical protein